MIFFSITIHLPSLFLEFHARSLLLLCVAGVAKGPKRGSKKAHAHPKDHLERSLRPINATQVTPILDLTKKTRSLSDFK